MFIFLFIFTGDLYFLHMICVNSMLQVDNGVMDHLLPSLFKDDWDVLIAHFLGVVSLGICFQDCSLSKYAIPITFV